MHSLVTRQLRKAFGPDAAMSSELRAFVAGVSDAYVAADQDRKRHEHSLELASAELFERNRALEDQLATVTRLEAHLDRRNRDMTTILDNVAGGFVTVGLDGSLAAECSLALTRWFGPLDREVPVWRYLFGTSDLAAWAELGFASLRDGTIPTEVVLQQLPPRTERDGRQIRLEYREVGSPISAVLVVASDITDELARAHADRIQAELVAVIGHAVTDRLGVIELIRTTDELVAHFVDPAAPLTELRRTVHTIKGNTALYGIATVAEVCHEIETRIVDDGVVLDAAARLAVRDAWLAFRDRAARLFDVSQHDIVIVDRAGYRETLALLPDGPAADRIRRWGHDATRPHLERFGVQARQLAARLAKPELEVEIVDCDVSVERERFAQLWPALGHAVRNAVDHGIEPSEQRVAAGKPEHGRLALRTCVRDDALIVEIEDDGAGIDWPRLTDQARALGLTSEGDEVLFALGVSTAVEVTEVSGCGVGMGALRETCTALGGRVELSSEPGRGTAVRCIVPLVGSRPRSNPALEV